MAVRLTDKKKRTAVKNALEWIKANSIVLDDNSIQIKNSWTRYQVATEIIVLHTANDEFPERTHRGAVNLAIKRWLKFKKYQTNSDTVSAFLEALEVELKQIDNRQNLYTVLLFLNLDYGDIQGLESAKILGKDIIIKHWSELGGFQTDELWKKVWFHDRLNPIIMKTQLSEKFPNITVFQPVLFKVTTHGPEAAVGIANEHFDILRVCLNLPTLLGRFTYFRSEPQQLSKVLPSPVYGVFDDSGKLNATYFTIEKFTYTKAKINKEQLLDTRKIMSFFSEELRYPNTYHYVLNLVRLYQEATDISHPRPAFLAMWQVLESMVSFGQDRVAQNEIPSRVSALVELDPLFREALKIIADLRNKFVHYGQFLERSDDAFFTLKLIVDACLNRLFVLGKDFSTVHELRHFVEYASLGDNELQRRKNVISTIQRQRSN